MSIQEWLTLLLDWDKKQAQIHTDVIYSQINQIENTVDFFPGVIQKIKKLSNNYTLFLSTWNSDKFANDVLKKWWIHKCFDKILWSSYILKSSQHVNEFINYTWDEYFSERTIFIWDWEKDREIALENNIDFIHISTSSEDKYEIQSVVEIENILKIINK
jgi:phosphoglycolate phosphatase-like HAD superfamily hydrolase